MGDWIGKAQCPKCAARGADTAGDNLALYSDGGSFCFSCGYFTKGNKFNIEQEELTIMPEHTVETILGRRGISPEAIKAYNVSLMQDSNTGEMFVAFPIPDANGVGEKYLRRYYNPITGELSREMKFQKGTSLKNPLFGWHLVNKRTKTLVICEGNTDTLTAATYLHSDPTIVALGVVGARNAKRAAAHIIRHAPNLKIVLAFDNDEAGRQARKDFVDYYKEYSDNPILELRFDYKDLNDWLTNEPNVNLVNEVANAQPILSSEIIGAAEISDALSEYLNVIEHNKYITLQFSPSLSNALRLMPGKLVGVIGDSGKGKSTLVEQIALEALADGKNVFMISAEMRPEEVALKLVRNARGINYYDREVLLSMTDADKKDLQEFTRALLRRFKMFSRFGSCSTKEISDKIHELVASGVTPNLVIIDHLLAIAGEGSTEELENIAKHLKAIAESHKVPIIVLAHVRKQAPQNRKTVYRPQLSDIYNTGGLGRYADIVLGVGLDPEKRITYVETIKLERMGGGYADVQLKLNNWSLQEIDEDATLASERVEADDDDEYEVM